jgi:hypothetical protein
MASGLSSMDLNEGEKEKATKAIIESTSICNVDLNKV